MYKANYARGAPFPPVKSKKEAEQKDESDWSNNGIVTHRNRVIPTGPMVSFLTSCPSWVHDMIQQQPHGHVHKAPR